MSIDFLDPTSERTIYKLMEPVLAKKRKEARKQAFLEAAEMVKHIDFAIFPDSSSRTSIKLYIFELFRTKANEEV